MCTAVVFKRQCHSNTRFKNILPLSALWRGRPQPGCLCPHRIYQSRTADRNIRFEEAGSFDKKNVRNQGNDLRAAEAVERGGIAALQAQTPAYKIFFIASENFSNQEEEENE